MSAMADQQFPCRNPYNCACACHLTPGTKPYHQCAWYCPDCDWAQVPHPIYGWQTHDERAIEIHRSILCPTLRGQR